nr:PREDICTED: uncharacterized mitochondrial protein AtMg00810-like [Daucus carota subsp. sativus]
MDVYVDDIIVTGTDLTTIQYIKAHLHETFSINNLGRLHHFLGLEVDYVDEGITLTQSKFTKELLQDLPFDITKHVVTPMPQHLKIDSSSGPLLSNPELYRSLVGKLNYLTHTRPDLNYSVQVLSQFMHSPHAPHLDALAQVT